MILSFALLVCSDGYAQNQNPFPFVAEVTADSLNIRAGQSENFEKLFRLERGDHVVVLASSFSWYKIELPDGVPGFVNRQFVNQNTGRITGDRVNVRSRNGIQATILCQVNKEEDIEILERIDDWYRIKPLENCYGWVRQKYLKFHSKIPVSPVKLQVEDPETKKNIPIVKKTSLKIQPQRHMERAIQEKKKIQPVKNNGKLASKKNRKKKKKKERKAAKVLKNKKIEKGLKNKKVGKGLKDKKVEKDSKVQKNLKPEKIERIGVIKSMGNVPLSKIYVKLVTKDKKVYFLKGLHHILKGFVGETIKVEGDTQPESSEGLEFPVINVVKFQLVL